MGTGDQTQDEQIRTDNRLSSGSSEIVIAWQRLVDERNEWVAHNFPNHEPRSTFFGVLEEVGELTHHHIKALQRVRTEEDHVAGSQDAIGDLIIFLLGVMNMVGVPNSTKKANPYTYTPWGTNRGLVRDHEECLASLGREVGRLLGEELLYRGQFPAKMLLTVEHIVYYSYEYCKLSDWIFEAIVLETWARVKERNWVSDPMRGGE